VNGTSYATKLSAKPKEYTPVILIESLQYTHQQHLDLSGVKGFGHQALGWRKYMYGVYHKLMSQGRMSFNCALLGANLF
jgi:deoxyribodipyrimidine photolyase-like uncharacterized protein